MGEVAAFEMGQAPPGAECNVDGIGTLFVKAGEFGKPYPVEREWTTKPLKLGRRGDVFICVVGATAGKLNLGIDCAIGRSVAAIRPSAHVDTKFLYYQLQPWVLRLRAASAGSAQGVISKKQLSEIPVELPAVNEQRRIVAEIEKQFSRLDEAVANLQRVKANLRRFHTSTLKSALSGCLVPTEAELALMQGRDFESADELLKRLDRRPTERAAKGLGPGGDLAGHEGKLPKLPSGWSWVPLSRVTSIKGGITVDSKRVDSTSRPVPYLRVANVQRGYLDLAETKVIHAPAADIEALLLRPGDILFNEGGDRDKLGRGWIWEGQLPECIHQNHVFRARPLSREISSKLISWWGNTFGKDYFQREGKQTTNLASINLSKLSGFPVPVPPVAEQHRIVAEVDRRLSIVREVEAEVDANLKRAQALRQAVLARAFQHV
jgi:type I restriction enzyme, S subunit